MVKLSNLKNKQDNRQVRAVIESPTGSIVIYEPTKQDIADILDLQDMITAFNTELDSNTLEVSGQTIMRELIPLLTDIEIGDMTDEEIQDTIDNPTLAMLQVTHILKGIVADIYKNIILSTINQIKDSDIETLADELQNVSSSSLLTNVAHTEDGKEMATEVVKEAKKQDIENAKVTAEEQIKQAEVEKQIEEEKAIDDIANEDKDSNNEMSYEDVMAARTMAHFADLDEDE